MPFIGTGYYVGLITAWISVTILSFFNALDAIQFGDIPYSLLDVFIALLILEMVIDFIMRVLRAGNDDDTDKAEDYTPVGGSESGDLGQDSEADITGEPQ